MARNVGEAILGGLSRGLSFAGSNLLPFKQREQEAERQAMLDQLTTRNVESSIAGRDVRTAVDKLALQQAQRSPQARQQEQQGLSNLAMINEIRQLDPNAFAETDPLGMLGLGGVADATKATGLKALGQQALFDVDLPEGATINTLFGSRTNREFAPQRTVSVKPDKPDRLTEAQLQSNYLTYSRGIDKQISAHRKDPLADPAALPVKRSFEEWKRDVGFGEQQDAPSGAIETPPSMFDFLNTVSGDIERAKLDGELRKRGIK